MTLFIDASALIAMTAREPEQTMFRDILAADGDPLWSAMSCWETVSGLQSSYKIPVDKARRLAEDTARLGGFRLVAIGSPEMTLALDAYQTFGKGRHPARLNMGDCFAYSCAKTNAARLLYKGDDFSKTDLA